MAGAFAPDDTSPDEKAQQEAAAFVNEEDLELDAKRQKHGRHQTFQGHANNATLGLLWVVVVLIGFAMLVFAWHLLTPDCWHWLSDAALTKLQTLLGAAVLSSALTTYANRRLAD